MAYRNIRLHPFLRLIYFCLRVLCWAGTGIFYRRKWIRGKEYLSFDGPAIVISNHPSTLMDPLNVGIPIRQEMFFLANYGLFKHPVSNWLLSRLYCIPIKRKEDVKEGESRNNDDAFEQCYRHFEKAGILYIAPEGYSWMDRLERPFKTGTARIAFGAEMKNNWKLGMKILPVGLTYTAPNLFRSDAVVQFGEPLLLQPWRAAAEQDLEKAVDDLTAELERRVRALCLQAPDENAEKALAQWVTMRVNNRAYTPEEYLALRDKVKHPEAVQAVLDYRNKLTEADIDDRAVAEISTREHLGETLRRIFFLTAGAPFFAAGALFWLVPCFLPWALAKRMKLYVGYDSNVKLLAGLFIFGGWLWAAWHVFYAVFGLSWVAWSILTFFIGCGFWAEYYLDMIKAQMARWKGLRLGRRDPAQAEDLILTRLEHFS